MNRSNGFFALITWIWHTAPFEIEVFFSAVINELFIEFYSWDSCGIPPCRFLHWIQRKNVTNAANKTKTKLSEMKWGGTDPASLGHWNISSYYYMLHIMLPLLLFGPTYYYFIVNWWSFLFFVLLSFHFPHINYVICSRSRHAVTHAYNGSLFSLLYLPSFC